MAKKIELLHTTYDESGNIESQEVVHPLTSPNCIIMENGKTLDEVMGDGIATPTLTHEGTSFKVGVGDSNIEVVDGDVAGMTLKGQSYQNILPKPTTLIMETDEKEFKINDKIDSNIIIDDNIAEIATVKGKTIVNAVQEESASEYTVLGEDLSGQSIVTSGKVDGNIKGVTLQGQTLVNTIQEPCKDDYVVLGAEDGIEISAETGGCGTIENTVQGGINGAVLEGQTLVNLIRKGYNVTSSTIKSEAIASTINLDPTKKYTWIFNKTNTQVNTRFWFTDGTYGGDHSIVNRGTDGYFKVVEDFSQFTDTNGRVIENISIYCTDTEGSITDIVLLEGDYTNVDIPYFEGMKSVQMPVVKTTGKNLFDKNYGYTKGYIDNDLHTPTEQDMFTNHYSIIPSNTQLYTNANNIYYYDKNKKWIGRATKLGYTSPSNASYARIQYLLKDSESFEDVLNTLWLSTENMMSYEPYQSSTVSINDYTLNSSQFEQGTVSESVAAGATYKEISYMDDTRLRSKSLFKISGNAIRGTLNEGYGIFFAFFKDEKYLAKHHGWVDSTNFSVDVPYECTEFCITLRKTTNSTIDVSEYDLIGLTLEQVVELRAIGDVKDELDLQTGKLTQRIGEVVLDGTQPIYIATDYGFGTNYPDSNYAVFRVAHGKANAIEEVNLLNTLMGESLKCITWEEHQSIPQEGISNFHKTQFTISVLKSRLEEDSISGFKKWLQSNPITVQYKLEKESVKTVDLTVTNQDGNTIPHIQTQPTVTHITASSDHLIPTVTIDNNLAYDTIIKPSTLYTIRFKHDTVNTDNPLTVDLGGTVQEVTSTEFTITTPSELTHNQLVFSGKNNVVSEVQVIEGDVTNIEYPFFEGMSDVKFSDSKFVGRGRNIWQWGDLSDVGVAETTVNLEPGEYWFSCNSSITYDSRPVIVFFDENLAQITYGFADQSSHYTLPVKTRMIYLYSNGYSYQNSNTNLTSFTNIMLTKEPHVKTDYEPYKGVVEVQQDIDSIPLTSDMFEQGKFKGGALLKGMSKQQFEALNDNTRIRCKTLIPIKPNTQYKFAENSMFKSWFYMMDKDGLYIGRYLEMDENNVFIGKTAPNAYYIIPILLHNDGITITPSVLDSMNLILQEVPQEIVLRGIGDVKDELDLTRGEYIQRIGEVVLDGYNIGTSYWYTVEAQYLDTKTYYISTGYFDSILKPLGRVTSDILPEGQTWDEDYECVEIQSAKNGFMLRFRVDKTKLSELSIAGFIEFLKKNPITVQYELATPIIHKVNLTNTKVIPSYATETHYETITPSDSLIPNITIPSTLNYNVAIKPSTEYTIRANTYDNLTVDLGGATGTLSNGKVTLTTPTTLTHNEVKFSGTGKVKELMVVEGNEIKDNVPFFNGMKNVEMGGIKLVNIARGATVDSDKIVMNANKTQFTYTSTGGNEWCTIRFNATLLKPNTLYTIYMNIITNTLTGGAKISLGHSGKKWLEIGTATGIYCKTMATTNILSDFGIFIRRNTEGQQLIIKDIMIIEGDWTHLDEIPYIESEMIIDQPIIRSQGKNLFDKNKSINGAWIDGTNGSITHSPDNFLYTMDVKPNTTYTASLNGTIVDSTFFAEYSGTPSPSTFIRLVQTGSITTSSTTKKIILAYSCSQIYVNETKNNIQIEEGSTATPYEPFKHQTLYSNRVIGYEENCYHSCNSGVKITNTNANSMLADVEGLTVAYVTNGGSNFAFYDKDMVFISGKPYLDTGLSADNKNGFIQVPLNAKYMRFASGNKIDATTDYTKATVTGDLPLRSLPNGVCDTLNLVTGEYVQRVGEVVLDGSEENISQDLLANNFLRFNLTSYTPNMLIGSSLKCDKLPAVNDTQTTNLEVIHSGTSGNYKLMIWISRTKLQTQDVNGLNKYLSQNPITVQYELETPIVRKLGFTTKGNYAGITLNGGEDLYVDGNINNADTARFEVKVLRTGNTVYYDPSLATVWFDNFDSGMANTLLRGQVSAWSGDSVMFALSKYNTNVTNLQEFKQWLGLNSSTLGFLTKDQTSESYSNIHKPIFFNNVDVQFLPNNVDIQPQLTLQARTRNSYVMDMMKANTTYTMKCLAYSNSAKLYVANSSANTSVSSNKTLQFAQSHLDGSKNELVLVGQWYEPMIIEGDVTGKNLPYFKGILSSYHDVDEIEIHSVNKNLLDINNPYSKPDKVIIDKNSVRYDSGVTGTVMYYVYVREGEKYYTTHINSSESTNNSSLRFRVVNVRNGETIVQYRNGSASFVAPYTGYVSFDVNRVSANSSETTIGSFMVALNNLEHIYQQHQHNTTSFHMPTRLETVKVVRPVMEEGRIDLTNGELQDNYNNQIMVRNANIISVQPNDYFYCRNGQNDRYANIVCYDINKNFICYYTQGSKTQGYLPNNCYFINFYIGKNNCSDLTITIQRNKPIQLNSLPNGVCDEIIMKPNSNKAQLVQRVGKVVLDGCYYTFGAPAGEVKGNDVMCKYIPYTDGKNGGLCISDRFLTPTYSNEYTNIETIMFGTNTIIMSIRRARTNSTSIEEYLKDNPITVYYELETPIIHEIQLKGYPHVYEDGTVTLNTDTPHQTLVSYNVNQEQLINTQNETIIRHDQQIDDLYYYIEMYLEEIYQMELFRMKLELSL